MNNLNSNTYCCFFSFLGFTSPLYPLAGRNSMRKVKQLLIRRGGQNIALVEDLSSVLDIGKGLIGSREPDITEGLFEGVLLQTPGYRKKCRGIINSIHMIGMRYPISVFWISENIIVDKAYAMPGFHVYSSNRPSTAVLELSKEAFSVLNTGDVLSFEPIS